MGCAYGILLSLWAVAVCEPAGADIFADTLSACSTRFSTLEAYNAAFVNIGWIEVFGRQGEAVLDRTVWTQLPSVPKSAIATEDPRGVECFGMSYECSRSALGQLHWSPKAKTQAFVNGQNALFVFSRMNDRWGDTPFVADYVHCDMIAPDPAPQSALLETLEATRWWSAESKSLVSNDPQPRIHEEPFHKTETGWLLREFRYESSSDNRVLPRTTVNRTIYIPNQNIIKAAGLKSLDYARGFSTQVMHNYEGVTP